MAPVFNSRLFSFLVADNSRRGGEDGGGAPPAADRARRPAREAVVASQCRKPDAGTVVRFFGNGQNRDRTGQNAKTSDQTAERYDRTRRGIFLTQQRMHPAKNIQETRT